MTDEFREALKKSNKLVPIAASLIILGTGATMFRDNINPPKHYHPITAGQISSFDGQPVELSMTPIYVGNDGTPAILREGSNFLKVKPSDVDGSIFRLRNGHQWRSLKDAAFASIENMVLSEDQTPITVRGMLNGNVLDTYSITTGDGTYSVDDRRNKK
ncbi:hypothetical protein HOG54_01865 [Candidatus Woesearchaeota archaeon]|jgi:hypothetical protein|nr:hypothetical protein [Candidatus Woesearchaeota archaeon]